MKPGIYFGLSESDYHAAPALSNSGIKNLRISTLDFYMRSWLNPGYEPNETNFMRDGRAYHKRILEGRAAFYAEYDAELDLADYPGVLVSHADYKAVCKEIGAKISGTKSELAARIHEDNPNVKLWDDLVAEHAARGKTLLPGETIQQIELSAKMIELHPELSKCFTGGYPEVSIFWDHDGVPMKARIDYLKPQAIVDLKTFGNAYGKPVDRAIATAMASERYHIQAAVYSEAVEAAKEHVRRGRVYECLNGETGDMLGNQVWLGNFCQSDQTFVFVFQQTGIAPVARGKVFPRQLVYDCGKSAMLEAIDTFRQCRERYGEDPWIDTAEIGIFDDAEFPAWMVEV